MRLALIPRWRAVRGYQFGKCGQLRFDASVRRIRSWPDERPAETGIADIIATMIVAVGLHVLRPIRIVLHVRHRSDCVETGGEHEEQGLPSRSPFIRARTWSHPPIAPARVHAAIV